MNGISLELLLPAAGASPGSAQVEPRQRQGLIVETREPAPAKGCQPLPFDTGVAPVARGRAYLNRLVVHRTSAWQR